MACSANLKQIGLALHDYAQQFKVFPPGTVSGSSAGYPYDIWTEACETDGPPNHYHGTSWMLGYCRLSKRPTSSPPELSHGVSGTAQHSVSGVKWSNSLLATRDIKTFYCPTRRGEVRRGVDEGMFGGLAYYDDAANPPGGGTDYGGCYGRHIAFNYGDYTVVDASDENVDPTRLAVWSGSSGGGYAVPGGDAAGKRWGLFGMVNVSQGFGSVRDGLSNTIVTGEMQRITTASGSVSISCDGWAIGGNATGFSCGLGIAGSTPTDYRQPGSDHPGGANFGIGDGSVRFMSGSTSPDLFGLLGSINDGVSTPLSD